MTCPSQELIDLPVTPDGSHETRSIPLGRLERHGCSKVRSTDCAEACSRRTHPYRLLRHGWPLLSLVVRHCRCMSSSFLRARLITRVAYDRQSDGARRRPVAHPR